MCRQVSLIVQNQIALFIHVGILCRARLAGYRYLGDAQEPGRAIRHRLTHTQAHERQVLIRYTEFPDGPGLKRTHHPPSGICDLVDELWLIERAAIGHSGSRIEHLQRRGQNIALPDSRVVGVTGHPVLAIVLAFPAVIGHQAGSFAR